MSRMTFDFLQVPEFTRRFPFAHPPQSELPTSSRDGILRLLEAEQADRDYLFIMRGDKPGLIWSRHLRALFQNLPIPIVAVHVSTTAHARQDVRESLQWHFIDVTAPEDDFPPDDRGSDSGNGAPVPRGPLLPSRFESGKRWPDEAA